MWKNYARPLILLCYLSLFCLRYFSLWFVIPFTIGGVIGFYFSYVEGIVGLFLHQKEREEQKELFTLLKRGNIHAVARLIKRQAPQQSMIKSWLFVGVYIVMGLFVMTSTQSFVGEGIILGLGLQYVLDFMRHRKKLSPLLVEYGPMEEELLRKVPTIFSIIFVIFSLLGLRLL